MKLAMMLNPKLRILEFLPLPAQVVALTKLYPALQVTQFLAVEHEAQLAGQAVHVANVGK